MKRIIVLFFLITTLSFYAAAQVPGTISYQGYLTKPNGSPAEDGAHTVKFDFYDGSTKVMERGPISVTTDKGLFTTIIGSGSANNAAFTPAQWTKPLTVKMTVDGVELATEVTLTAVPYAIVAGGVNAANVSGTLAASNIPSLDGSKITTGTISGALVGTGINASNLTTGTVTGSLVGTGINATNITSGTIADARLETTIDRTIVNSSDYMTAVGGVHVGSTTDPLNNLVVDNFTQLGLPPSITPPSGVTISSPSIKMLKITGTTAASQGNNTIIATGILGGKILSIDVVVDYASEDLVGPEFTKTAAFQFSVSFVNGSLYVMNSAANSGSILSKPFKALIIYEE